MIINEIRGLGRRRHAVVLPQGGLGPLVGKRTWGGLIGIFDFPVLMDGRAVTAPRIAIYGLNGEWEVENHGVAPDIEVEYDRRLASRPRSPVGKGGPGGDRGPRDTPCAAVSPPAVSGLSPIVAIELFVDGGASTGGSRLVLELSCRKLLWNVSSGGSSLSKNPTSPKLKNHDSLSSQ